MLQGSPELEAISHDKLYTLMQKSHQDKWISSEMKFQDVFPKRKDAGIIALYSLGGLLLHFRSCDDTLENLRVYMNNFEMDKGTVL